MVPLSMADKVQRFHHHENVSRSSRRVERFSSRLLEVMLLLFAVGIFSVEKRY